MWHRVSDWAQWWWIPMLSLVVFLAGLAVARWFVIRIPADYFLRQKPLSSDWLAGHRVLRIGLLAAKNAAGIGLLAMGLTMLLTPGPGTVALLAGLAMIDFPGKRTLERRLVSRPSVLKALNSIRAKAGRPPLKVQP
jgi:hypothetical protein